MDDKIEKYLNKIEKDHGIRILYACETGSRAWGFPSPDSDFDIRMIYVHPKDWYLSLIERKDTIELMAENNDLDITGWDLRKALRLLLKSNPPLLERIQSPIIYRKDDQFIKEINIAAKHAYSRIATIHHYLSMGKKCLSEIKEREEYKLKKFFYALRATIACKWILERIEIPPIEFQKMLSELDIKKDLIERIQELIALKLTLSESYYHHGEQELFTLMEQCIAKAEDGAKALPAAKGNIEELNILFRKNLRN